MYLLWFTIRTFPWTFILQLFSTCIYIELLEHQLIFQANEHHREHLESLPSTPYPLSPQGDAAEVPESQRITDGPLEQR